MFTKGEWKDYCLGSEGYQIRRNNDGVPAAKVKEELRERLTPIVERMGGSFNSQRANARLIVALVNAARKINPEHPERVAENLGKLVEQAHKAVNFLYAYSDNPSQVPNRDYSRFKEIYMPLFDALAAVEANHA